MAAVAQDTGMRAPAQGRLRPRSMYQASSVSSAQDTDGKMASRSIRPPDVVNKNTSSVPQLAGLNRTQSLRKPDIPVQSAQIPNSRAHTRTKSINNIIPAARKEASDSKRHSERPKSISVEPSHIVKPPSNTSADTVPGAIRSSGRLAALKRSASTRTKPEVSETSESSRQDDVATTSRHRELPRDEAKKQARPAFSTLQQHFTPRKAGKAPTSTFLHPQPPDNKACILPSEMISLQSELLQLHILHASAAQTCREWEASARKHLRGKFDEVASLYQVMRENEQQGQEQKNLQALRDWNSGNATFALVEHIQILSGPLHELPSLVDTGGRFRRLVDDFECWMSNVEAVWMARSHSGNERNRESGHVEGLGDLWRAENAALTRKLTSFSRDLDGLTQPASGSSIASILATCKILMDGLLDELQTMQTIEHGVVTREQDWVETHLHAIARGVGGVVVMDEGSEAWRM